LVPGHRRLLRVLFPRLDLGWRRLGWVVSISCRGIDIAGIATSWMAHVMRVHIPRPGATSE